MQHTIVSTRIRKRTGDDLRNASVSLAKETVHLDARSLETFHALWIGSGSAAVNPHFEVCEPLENHVNCEPNDSPWQALRNSNP